MPLDSAIFACGRSHVWMVTTPGGTKPFLQAYNARRYAEAGDRPWTIQEFVESASDHELVLHRTQDDGGAEQVTPLDSDEMAIRSLFPGFQDLFSVNDAGAIVDITCTKRDFLFIWSLLQRDTAATRGLRLPVRSIGVQRGHLEDTFPDAR
jgi:hypothetical protein